MDPWFISTLVSLSAVHFCRGNWIGEAPYRHGRPCSHCPPSYGGGCRNNLCYKGVRRHMVSLSGCSNVALPVWPRLVCSSAETAETQDMNEVEKPQVPPQPRTTAVPAPKPKPKPSATKKPVSNTNTSRTPSSTASSGTYFGTNNCILIIWRWGFSFFNTFFVSSQLRTSSVRLGCGTNVEG